MLFTVSHQFYTVSKSKPLDAAVCIQCSFIINIFNQLKTRELFFLHLFYFEYKRWTYTSVYK